MRQKPPRVSRRDRLAVRGAVLALAAAFCTISCLRSNPPEADLILTNGIVHAVPGSDPPATAIAIRLGRILTVGDEMTVFTHRGPTTPVVDLGGATVIPGLIDANVQLLSIGETLLNDATGESLYLDLSETQSEEDAVQRVRARVRALPPRSWVLGKGWDEARWTKRELPDRKLLSDIVPYNPAFLVHARGHMAWLNKAALDKAGFSARTSDPPGGRILRSRRSGEPTGILLDRAWIPVLRLIPPLTREEKTQAILQSLLRLASKGYTSVHAMASPGRLGLHDIAATAAVDVQIFRDLALAGRLPIRVSLLVPGPSEAAEDLLRRGPEIGIGDGRLDIRTIFLSADASLLSRGAALLTPYADDPSGTGSSALSEEEIASWAGRALRRGVQVAVEAHGDAVVRAAASGFATALAASPGADARFRIDRLTLFDPDDLRRLTGSGVVAAVHPAALLDFEEVPLVETRVGPERAARLYAFGTLLEAGLGLAGASYSADRLGHPLSGFYTAVTRKSLRDQSRGGWHVEQKLGRREALRMFTLGAAHTAFRDREFGSLEPGKWADLAVLSQDILVVPEDRILSTEVLATYIAGREVYRKERPPGP